MDSVNSPEYRIVILDAYDISAIGWPHDDPKTSEAVGILRAKNPNEDKNNPNELLGRDRRFVMFNGAIGGEQLLWLDYILKDSTERDQRVVICCHLLLDPDAAAPEALLWNSEEVMMCEGMIIRAVTRLIRTAFTTEFLRLLLNVLLPAMHLGISRERGYYVLLLFY